jgi:hypothetical protein
MNKYSESAKPDFPGASPARHVIIRLGKWEGLVTFDVCSAMTCCYKELFLARKGNVSSYEDEQQDATKQEGGGIIFIPERTFFLATIATTGTTLCITSAF